MKISVIPEQTQETKVEMNIRRQIEPFFYPDPSGLTSPEYQEFMRVREKILGVIRADTPEKAKVLDDLVETLLANDPNIPTDIISGLLSFINIGKAVKERKKKREIYMKVITSILEKIFDPGLEFKMSKKDILDIFEANDLDRDNVFRSQIGKIYVKVIENLEVGKLRDITYEEQLFRYVQLKLGEIRLSRQYWELNG